MSQLRVTVMTELWCSIIILVLAVILTACRGGNTVTEKLETLDIATNHTPQPVTKTAISDVTEIDTPTIPPTVTFTPSPSSTRTPTPTSTFTPTPTDIAQPDVAKLCGIGRNSPPQVDTSTIYFHTYQGDWYRTSDRFTTVEQVAPDGILSPDIKQRLIFGCDGPGSICVADPPETTPVPLSSRYEPQEGGVLAYWLPDNQRIIFQVFDVPYPGSDQVGFDIRLYLLDLRSDKLYQIKDMLGFKWAISPLTTCVAYVAFDGPDQTQRFHITNIETSNDFQDWSVPVEKSNPKWPDWQDEMVWSPDGSQLAFSSDNGRNGLIVVWNPASGERKEYKLGKGIAYILKWNPDGNKIYFVAVASKSGSAHWILDVNTGEFQELTETHSTKTQDACLWLSNGEEIIVPDRFGSLLLNTTDGSVKKLTYPESDSWKAISTIFFGQP